MAYDSDMDDLLTTTVTYNAYSSMTVSGAQTFSTASLTIQARIEHETRLVRDNTGNQVVSMGRIFLKPTSTTGSTYIPTIKDKITLPSGYAPQTPPLITVMRHLDDEGLHHYEIAI